ncbi:uncharacterized protein LOC143329231 [Chaetodon auriga]|uniref:uncharacterized protein LOC143329231 n=1 Tax=Chaetodon auriga TaxID=39042 RepID=UPI004032FE46
MWLKCLRFVLLVWFPGVLHAQSAALPCPAPTLSGGYFVPEHETYADEATLTYACESGRKPVVEGWWATITCQNGKWSHEPQCIDENACIPPEIPNAKITENPNGWYTAGQRVRITCDKGYEHKDNDATTICENGTWISVPACEKSTSVCDEPPKVNHAVIVRQGYQKLFAPDSKVQYECEDGYTVMGGDNKKTIFCISGSWSEKPTCGRITRPGTGQGGSAEVGTSREHVTSTDRGTRPAGGDRGTRPGTGHGGSTVGGTGGGHTSSVGSGTQPADRDTRPGTGHDSSTVGGTGGQHTSSVGSGTQPADRDTRPGTGHGGSTVGGTGSSTTLGGDGRDSGPPFTPISNCGDHPVVPDGVVVQTDRLFLKYRCNAFYTQVGSDTVVCHSDGSWSQLPVCKDTFCVLDPAQYAEYNIKIPATEYLKDGETTSFCRPLAACSR